MIFLFTETMIISIYTREEVGTMIKSKRMLFISISILSLAIILNFPYPHRYPFGNVILTSINIPTTIFDGFLLAGILTTIFLLIGLYVLSKSLNKFQGRII